MKDFIHEQSVLSAQWTVRHDFGERPSVVKVAGPDGLSVRVDVLHLDPNTTLLYLSTPMTGRARCLA